MFGGYFGDVITVVSRTFFHHEITVAPVWFAPLDNPMKMLIYSLLFGLIHLLGGLALKGYMCLKKKRHCRIHFRRCIMVSADNRTGADADADKPVCIDCTDEF